MHTLMRLRRRIRRLRLRMSLTIGIFFRRRVVHLQRNRARVYWATRAASIIALATLIAALVGHHKSGLRTQAEALSSNGTLSQLGIAIGAAMLGVIGIVFSLNIFSVQQVAERGTLLTLREYANDWVLRLVYWSLAVFAILAVAVALFGKNFAVYSLGANFAILIAAVLLLKTYFNRAIKFSDPHFTVSKIAKRGRKFLKVVRRLERAVEAEIRYARRKE